MKAFALIRMVGGQPDLPEAAQGLVNYTLCDRIPGTSWGAYLVAATGANLQDLDTLWGGFIGIIAVSDSGDVHWGELENPAAEDVRSRLNTWLDARDMTLIPEQWTNRQVVRAIFREANQRFDFRAIDIMDV
jgi:hypothetical protein